MGYSSLMCCFQRCLHRRSDQQVAAGFHVTDTASHVLQRKTGGSSCESGDLPEGECCIHFFHCEALASCGSGHHSFQCQECLSLQGRKLNSDVGQRTI